MQGESNIPVAAAGRSGFRRPSRRGCDNTGARSCRRGLTLFEVIIALAIFVGSLAAIGQLIASGSRAAVDSRLKTQAIFRCESKMSEVVAGAVPLRQTPSTTFLDNSEWTWSLGLSAGPHQDLYLVEVTASHVTGGTMGAVEYSLRRLVRDPQLAIDALLKAQEDAAAAATSSSTSSSSTGSGSSGSGSSGSGGSGGASGSGSGGSKGSSGGASSGGSKGGSSGGGSGGGSSGGSKKGSGR